MVVFEAHRLLLFVVSPKLKESPEKFYYNEGSYQLLHRTDTTQSCKLVPSVSDALNGPLNLKGGPVGERSEVLQRCNQRDSLQTMKFFS